jgi:hypothetical protein
VSARFCNPTAISISAISSPRCRSPRKPWWPGARHFARWTWVQIRIDSLAQRLPHWTWLHHYHLALRRCRLMSDLGYSSNWPLRERRLVGRRIGWRDLFRRHDRDWRRLRGRWKRASRCFPLSGWTPGGAELNEVAGKGSLVCGQVRMSVMVIDWRETRRRLLRARMQRVFPFEVE